MYAKNDWASHGIGHVLTSLYGLTHAETLALCIPRVFKFFSKKKKNRLIKLNNLVFLKFFNSSNSIKNLLKFLNFLNISYNFEDYNLNKYQVQKDLKNYFIKHNYKTGHEKNTIVNYKNIEKIINIKI